MGRDIHTSERGICQYTKCWHIHQENKLENLLPLVLSRELASTCFSQQLIVLAVSLERKSPVQYRNYFNQYIKFVMDWFQTDSNAWTGVHTYVLWDGLRQGWSLPCTAQNSRSLCLESLAGLLCGINNHSKKSVLPTCWDMEGILRAVFCCRLVKTSRKIFTWAQLTCSHSNGFLKLRI